PIIRLQSTSIATGPAGAYTFTGNLIIKDVTRPVEFNFTATLKATGYLFEGSFDINRLDFHVGKESATMSEKVRVTLTVLAK
ncbi:MAG: YceI family protein, partial [Chitinophagaceae bacterium]